MKLLILDDNYPHSDNLFGDVFVHVRVKEYAIKHTVKVIAFFHSNAEIIYEGILIEVCNSVEDIYNSIKMYQPDKLLIHFYQSWMLNHILKKFSVPAIIWVHGYEALGWYRRLFNYSWYSPVLLKYIQENTQQQYHFRKLINYSNINAQVQFVFVSNWMKNITEQDTFTKIKRYSIIANPIDTNLFSYKEKSVELRKKVLLLNLFTQENMQTIFQQMLF